MKKNIVILDINGSYLESAIATQKYNIKLFLLNDIWQRDKCIETYKNSVENYYYRCPYSNSEYNKMNKTDYNLTYEEIEKFRSTQLKD